ncbi:S26 family signal peptidase [Bdellovibrionota bacterium FG-2]
MKMIKLWKQELIKTILVLIGVLAFRSSIAEPKRGEIIVFRYPEDPSINFIKRLVGLPGGDIEIQDGWIRVNGRPLSISGISCSPSTGGFCGKNNAQSFRRSRKHREGQAKVFRLRQRVHNSEYVILTLSAHTGSACDCPLSDAILD